MYEIESINSLHAKLDQILLREKKQEAANRGTSSSQRTSCEICGASHYTSECNIIIQETMSEQANAIDNQYNTRTYGNPYSNTYNPGWRNHPNFSWSNQSNSQSLAQTNNPPGFQRRPHNPPAYQTQQALPAPPQAHPTESMLENIILMLKKNDERMDQMQTHIKLLENQIAQNATASSSSQRNQGKLPSQPEVNPREQVQSITLRSGKQFNSPQLPQKEDDKEPEPVRKPEDEPKPGPVVEKPYVPPPPYQPPLPFPQRQRQAKLQKQFEKFVSTLKNLSISVPFIDMLSQMPAYAKFLKEMLSNKRKLEEYGTIALTEECSAILQNKLPEKLKDPGSFSIPCALGNVQISKALCDLGASVSLIPLSICKKLNMGDPKPTSMSLQLADRSIKYPVGIIEDVPLKVGKLFIPVDFVVLDMEEDRQIPIILGRPFLATAGQSLTSRMVSSL